MHWLCPDCDGGEPADADVRCVGCGRHGSEFQTPHALRSFEFIGVWLCVPCGGTQPQAEDESARCFKCRRTFNELVAVRAMPLSGVFHGTPVIESPATKAVPIPDGTPD
jgi:hypothetical protein